MFSLESPPLDASPAFIASSIIHKPFDRHMDADVFGRQASQEASAAPLELLPTSDITRGQLVAGLFLFQVITPSFSERKQATGSRTRPAVAAARSLPPGCLLRSHFRSSRVASSVVAVPAEPRARLHASGAALRRFKHGPLEGSGKAECGIYLAVTRLSPVFSRMQPVSTVSCSL